MSRGEYALYNTRTRTVVGITLLTEDEAAFVNRKCQDTGSGIRLIPVSTLARTQREESEVPHAIN